MDTINSNIMGNQDDTPISPIRNEQKNYDGKPEANSDFSYSPNELAPVINPFLVKQQTNSKKQAPEELLRRMFEKRIPEPTFDQDKADRLQKIANINQAGRGLSVLGGILASGLGAPVRRNEPDTTAPSIYSNYQANLDKYKSEKDANILRNYAKDVEDIKYGISNAYRDQANELANKRQADWMKAKEADNKLSWAKWSAEWDRNNKKDQETVRHNKAMEKEAMIRANRPTRSEINGTKTTRPYMVVSNNGEDVPLSQTQFRDLYNQALSDPNFTDKSLRRLKRGGGSIEDRRNLVHKFYQFKNSPQNTTPAPQQPSTKVGPTYKFPGLGHNGANQNKKSNPFIF